MTVDEFIQYFNLGGNISVSTEEFEHYKQIAVSRFSSLLGYTFPDVPTELEKEILFHLILIELLKRYTYQWSEKDQRVSIKKVTSNLERLIWQQKTLMTQRS